MNIGHLTTVHHYADNIFDDEEAYDGEMAFDKTMGLPDGVQFDNVSLL